MVVVHGDFGNALTELSALSHFRYKIICRDCHGVGETLLHPAGKVGMLRLERFYLSSFSNVGATS